MLSVLIPVYHWDVTNLVTQIHKQLIAQGIIFEIIIIDDASNSLYNTINNCLNSLSNCSFQSLNKNIGRSKLRNKLVEQSSFDWLLFLDADVLLPANFINIYITSILENKYDVFVGGVKYPDKYKQTYKTYLRWKFGKSSEEVAVTKRQKKSFKYFFTANFLIKKSVFQEVNFDENLLQYGYEDLLFSKQLKQNQFQICHLDNPVAHLGIDKNDIFLNKTKQGLKNLHFLLINQKLNFTDTNISLLYKKMQYLKLMAFLVPFEKTFEFLAVKKSSVLAFQLFKLVYLHQVFKNSK